MASGATLFIKVVGHILSTIPAYMPSEHQYIFISKLHSPIHSPVL